MKAVVVYESLWGNTAATAHAIAAGIGPDAQALPTDQASDAIIAEAGLIVAHSAPAPHERCWEAPRRQEQAAGPAKMHLMNWNRQRSAGKASLRME